MIESTAKLSFGIGLLVFIALFTATRSAMASPSDSQGNAVQARTTVCHHSQNEPSTGWTVVQVKKKALHKHLHHGDCIVDDAIACTEDDCDPSAGCIHAARPEQCDDTNSCTEDSCGASGCINVPISGCCHTDADCVLPDTCGGAGESASCGCTPTSCEQLGLACGSVPDHCGGTLDCGPPCSVAECLHENAPIQFADATSDAGYPMRDGLIMHDPILNSRTNRYDGDFGDTAQREGWYWLGAWIRQNQLNQPWSDDPPRQLSFDDVLRRLEPNGDGIFVRAPGKDPFGRATDGFDNNGFTVDQLVPLVAAMGVWGKHDALQRLWYALPEDVLGKHEFQGHWHNAVTNEDLYTNDPCNDIRNRDCTQRVDTRDCSRHGVCGQSCPFGICGDLCPCEVRGCPSDCPQLCHTECPCGTCSDWNCRIQVCLPFLGCHTECPCGGCGDMNCRIQVCIPDLECVGRKLDCERIKAQEEAACGVAEGACDVAREAQNALYAAEAVACVANRTADALLCESEKETGVLHFTGDILQPMTYNLFVRAGVLPVSFFPVTVFAVSPAGFALGETNLVGAIDVLRNEATGDIACPTSPDKLDCVDQDMNSTVMLLMSRYNLSTPLSESAIASYRSRAHSYGSYLNAYCAAWGPLVVDRTCPTGEEDCCPDKGCLNAKLTERIRDGIGRGWQPDEPGAGPYGAVRWYQRWSTRANPGLAVLYEPIFQSLLQ